MSEAKEIRAEIRRRIVAIIGSEEAVTCNIKNLVERIKARQAWNRSYERLEKVFYKHGARALAMNFTQNGRTFQGVTAGGKKWILYGNNGWTERSRYCGTLTIDGKAIFTSGRLDKVFDYILDDTEEEARA